MQSKRRCLPLEASAASPCPACGPGASEGLARSGRRAGSRMGAGALPLSSTQTCRATPRALRPARPWLGGCPACAASADPACAWGRWQRLRPLAGRQGGLLGSAARLPGPCCCIASSLASSAGPARSQVGICAGLPSGPLAGHLAASADLRGMARPVHTRPVLEGPCRRGSAGLSVH